MGFELAVVGGLLALFLAFYAIGKYSTSTPAEYLDWKPTRSIETEIDLELQDVAQMIEAQNEIRRRRGLPDRDEAEIEESVRRHREELANQARRYKSGDS